MKHLGLTKAIALVLVLLLSLGVSATATADSKAKVIELSAEAYPVEETGSYESMEEVAVYLYTFGRLPDNFITKREAQALGWDSREGNLRQVAPGASIGGDHFGNYEGNLKAPDGQKRRWTECDIDSNGSYRGAKRIVFSNDALIFYTGDHYNTFRQVIVTQENPSFPAEVTVADLDENGSYTAKEDVAAYLLAFGHLPSNYLTKREASELGWSSKKDNLGAVAPGCAIGGDRFGNREGLLPDQKGRTWKECDVNTKGGKRGSERIVFSNDGLCYYTADNHQSFERLH